MTSISYISQYSGYACALGMYQFQSRLGTGPTGTQSDWVTGPTGTQSRLGA